MPSSSAPTRSPLPLQEPEGPQRQRGPIGTLWRRVGAWLEANTFAPSWVPPRLRHPAFSYLAAMLLQAVAVSLTLLLSASLPAFELVDLLVILVVVLIALGWGGGPSLVATVLGLLLLEGLVFPPRFDWSLETNLDWLSDGLVLGVGVLISLVAGQMARARRVAEARADHLATVLEDLRETNERLDTFLGVASHELKTPLTSLKLSLQLTHRRLQRFLRQQVVATTEADSPQTTLEDGLLVPERQIEQLERLVHDLLDVTRIQAGKLELHPTVTDLSALLEQVVEEQRQAEPGRPILLHVPSGELLVSADPGRLEQVVTNYLTNARKYAPEGSPILVGAKLKKERACVWVQDAGPGVPLVEQERIWQRFHRVKGVEDQTGTGVGLGLGLHICRMIIEQHGGQVGVKSAPGMGATFWFVLPLAELSEPGEQLGS